MIVLGEGGNVSPEQVDLGVRVDESLYGGMDIEGVGDKLGKGVDKATQEERNIYFAPNIEVPAEAKNVQEVWLADRQKRQAALERMAYEEEALAQKLINEVIEEETRHYINLLDKTLESVDEIQESLEELERGVKYVNSQTAVNKG